MRIQVKHSMHQGYFLGHVDATLKTFHILTAGMPFRGKGKKGQIYGDCGLALFLKQLNTSSNFFN